MSEKKRTGPQAHISEKRSRRKCPVKKQANMSGRLCCAQGLEMCLKNPEMQFRRFCAIMALRIFDVAPQSLRILHGNWRKNLAIADFSRFKHALVPGWFKNFLYDFRYKKISGAHFPPWNRLAGCALSESAPVRNPPGIYPTLKCI